MTRLALRAAPALVATLALVLVLVPASSARAQEVTGPAVSPFGINAHVPDDTTLDRMVAAGVDWVRYDFNWIQLEPQQGQFNWGFMDRAVASARSRGLHIFATLAYAPGWANGNRNQSFPAVDPADWARFVTACVNRYGNDIEHWGMWNEPNLDHFYSGTRDQYIDEVLIVGARAAKAADPDCFVLGPELSDLNSGEWWDWLEDVMVRAGDEIDIVTHHIYDGDADTVFEELDGKPLSKPSFKYIMDSFGQGQEVWLTETGWQTADVSEPVQAAETRKLLEGVLARSYVTKVFPYEAKDDPNITSKWGIIRDDHSPKLAHGEVQAITNANPIAGALLRFEAETHFQHATGSGVPEGWQASASDPAGHALFGPYTTSVPPGDRTAVFRIRLDGQGPADEVVAQIDVHDATANQVIVERALKREDFHGAGWNQFWLNFQAPAGAQIELRVRHEGVATLTIDRVEVHGGRNIRGERGLGVRPCGAVPPGSGANLASLLLLGFGLLVLRRRAA